jgi:hypothetical protein
MRQLNCLFGLALAAMPATAFAECRPSFVDGSREVRLAASDSMDKQQLTDRFRVDVRNDGDSECKLRVRVTRDLGASDPGFPNYSLTGPGGNIAITSASPSDVSSGSGLIIVQPGARVPVSYGVAVPVSWGMRNGDYRQQLVFAVSEESSNTALATSQVLLKLEIPATARIRFAGVGGDGGARIDLGNLSTTVRTISSPFALRVLSTAGYQLRLSSQNGGRLRRTDGPDVIPYRLSVGGVPFNMASGDQLNVGQHTTSLGDVHSVQVTVDPDPTWHAGQYADRITVDVTPI